MGIGRLGIEIGRLGIGRLGIVGVDAGTVVETVTKTVEMLTVLVETDVWVFVIVVRTMDCYVSNVVAVEVLGTKISTSLKTVWVVRCVEVEVRDWIDVVVTAGIVE